MLAIEGLHITVARHIRVLMCSGQFTILVRAYLYPISMRINSYLIRSKLRWDINCAGTSIALGHRFRHRAHDARAARRAGIMHHAEKSYNDQNQSEFSTVQIRYRYRYFGKVQLKPESVRFQILY